jgi:hypothetical protein
MKVEPPYGAILDGLYRRDWIPFLGAGASRVGYQPGNSSFLPSGSELATLLADDVRFPSMETGERTDLAKVSSYYVDVSKRDALRHRLRRIFTQSDYQCNSLHRFLASIADNLLIISTNYDTLLEQAFIEAKKPYDLVVYPADNPEFGNAILWWRHGEHEPEKLKPNQLDIHDIGTTNIIYKMHGSIRQDQAKWDSFVITEEDYVRFLSRMNNAVPSAFRKYFSGRGFLFLGYGLRDWNFRVLLKEITGPQVTSWAILHQPSVLERTLWERRSVRIYDLKLEDFVEAISAEALRRGIPIP